MRFPEYEGAYSVTRPPIETKAQFIACKKLIADERRRRYMLPRRAFLDSGRSRSAVAPNPTPCSPPSRVCPTRWPGGVLLVLAGRSRRWRRPRRRRREA